MKKGSSIWLVTLLALVLLSGLPAATVHAYGGGGGGSDGSGGGESDASFSAGNGGFTGWGPGTWDVDPDLTDAIGGPVAGGSVDLGNPLTSQLQDVFNRLGGEKGTGKTFKEWLGSARAGKAMVQIVREGEQSQADGAAAGAHRTVVVLETLDYVGQKVQIVLGFCPPVSAPTSVALDAGRTFADTYNKALSEGKSTAEAIAAGLKQAAGKGVTTAITAGTLGNASGATWTKAKNLNPKRVRSVVNAGLNLGATGALKTGENVGNDIADSIRNAIAKAPANQAPPPAYAPAPESVTRGGRTYFK
jgi:hypothetical protein